MNLSFTRSRWIVAGTLVAGVIAATTFAATPAAPAPPTTPAPSTSEQPCGPRGGMDVAKIKERGAKMFAMIDTNGDGKITEAEFLAAKPPEHGGGMGHGKGPGMGGPGVGGPGVGGPGMGGPGMGMGPGMWHGMGPHEDMTDAQRQAFETKVFKALDTDSNGQLSPAEFAKAHETVVILMKKDAFARFDTNKDGVLTPDEFPPFPKHMAAMDTNGDGKVTREEMQAARAKQAPPPPAPAPTPN